MNQAMPFQHLIDIIYGDGYEINRDTGFAEHVAIGLRCGFVTHLQREYPSVDFVVETVPCISGGIHD